MSSHFTLKDHLAQSYLSHVTIFPHFILSHRLQPLQWRHNGQDSVSDHQPHDCLLNHLFRRRSKKTSKLRGTGLCVGNSPETGEFPAQIAIYAENVSIWWRHHDIVPLCHEFAIMCSKKTFHIPYFKSNMQIYVVINSKAHIVWRWSKEHCLVFSYGTEIITGTFCQFIPLNSEIQ